MIPTQTVDSLLEDLKHPLRDEVEIVRQIILKASPDIEEGIKWNSLSFKTTEWFATFNWRVKDQVQFVLHLGAKVKADAEVANIDDPDGLLKWQAKDRALLTLNPKDLKATEASLTALIQAWITHV
ncbi:MAG: DUF1801 domain-containing protein [Chlorobia bacterium]|nr:DUF1801 domain-containing protein [Fimbriimonadaceae bacterium]